MSEAPQAPSPKSPAPPVRPRREGWGARLVRGLLAGALALAAVVVVLIGWLGGTQSGLQSVIDLADVGLMGPAAAVMDGDPLPADATPRRTLTDGFRRLEVNFGRVWESRSATLRAEDPFTQARKVHDYLPLPPEARI